MWWGIFSKNVFNNVTFVCEDQASIQCRDVGKSTRIENKSLSGLGERKGFIIDNYTDDCAWYYINCQLIFKSSFGNFIFRKELSSKKIEKFHVN